MNKFRNIKTNVDGILFDSAKESRRYRELKMLQQAGVISRLECQPKFLLAVNGTKICSYSGDFAYFEANARVIEDVKSGPTKTPVYRLKRKLLLALFPGLDHREI